MISIPPIGFLQILAKLKVKATQDHESSSGAAYEGRPIDMPKDTSVFLALASRLPAAVYPITWGTVCLWLVCHLREGLTPAPRRFTDVKV